MGHNVCGAAITPLLPLPRHITKGTKYGHCSNLK